MFQGTVYYRLLSEEAAMPIRKHEGDAGWDLVVSKEVRIPADGWADVHTDIEIALPPTVWAMITGRSSTFRVRGLQVQTGIIDAGYRGELFIAVWNPGNTAQIIHPGERIAQLIPHERVELDWARVNKLPESDRGDKGFGSTGR